MTEDLRQDAMRSQTVMHRRTIAYSNILTGAAAHLRVARDVSDRVLMFNEGRIIEDATPEQMFNQPQQQRTRTFLGSVLEEA